jgi:hypothetical protein
MAYNENHNGAHNYYPAIENYKMANARKTKMQKWVSEVEDRQQLIEKMYASSNNFIGTMLTNFNNYGSLTSGQENAVRNIFNKEEDRKAAFKSADANSKFVGTVKVRQDFTLTMNFHTSFESDFGIQHVYIFKDGEGNVVVYKGSMHLDCVKGEVVKGKATVKSHNVREGINQTLISRPDFSIVN